MKRRTYLGLVSAGVLTSIAGCSSSGDGAIDGDNADTSTSTVDPAAEIDDAAAALNEAYATLDSQGDAISEEGERFDAATIRGSISTARDHLDAASEADLSDEQATTVENFRNVAAFLAAMTDTLEPVAAAFDKQNTASSYLDSDRYDDALAELEAAGSDASTAAEHLPDAEAAIEELDEESFSRLDVTYGEARDRLDRTRSMVEVVDPLVEGYRQLIRGIQEIDAGSAAMDEGRYGDAADRFSTAATRFDDAHGTLVEAENAAPSDARSTFVRLSCLGEASADGSRHFADGARAYEDGDTETGDSEFQSGQEAFQRCESGSAALATPAL